MSHIAVAIAQKITAQHQDIDSAIQGFTLPGAVRAMPINYCHPLAMHQQGTSMSRLLNC